MMPVDIVSVKAGINAGRLYVAVKGNRLLLGDFQTGETVKLSDIEVKPVVHAKWEKDAMAMYPGGYRCTRCGYGFLHTYSFCPNCGARMDGEPDG